MNFVTQLLTEPGFIPGHKPLKSGANRDLLDRVAARLHRELLKVLPSADAKVEHPWDLAVLYLQSDHLSEIRKLKTAGTESGALELIQTHLRIDNRHGSIYRHFGYANEPSRSDRGWTQYLSTWQANCGDEPGVKWQEELLHQVSQAIDKVQARPAETPFRSCYSSKANYRLIVPRVKEHSDGAMELDLYFYPWSDAIESTETQSSMRARAS